MNKNCGCKIESELIQVGKWGEGRREWIAYCPLHRSAETMLKALKECLGHSCGIEGVDFGYLNCCNRRDYKGHADECFIKAAIRAAEQSQKKEPNK